MVRHLPWDRGLVTLGTLAGVLGTAWQQRSVRTLCGVRVPFDAEHVQREDAGPIECPSCAHELADFHDALRELDAMQIELDLPRRGVELDAFRWPGRDVAPWIQRDAGGVQLPPRDET